MLPVRRQLEYVYADEVIPNDWKTWFWDSLSQSGSVTFGDNDHSLISAEKLLAEIKEIFDGDEDLSKSIPDEIKEKVFEILDTLESSNVLISL
jgi:hypothetical protein